MMVNSNIKRRMNYYPENQPKWIIPGMIDQKLGRNGAFKVWLTRKSIQVNHLKNEWPENRLKLISYYSKEQSTIVPEIGWNGSFKEWLSRKSVGMDRSNNGCPVNRSKKIVQRIIFQKIDRYGSLKERLFRKSVEMDRSTNDCPENRSK